MVGVDQKIHFCYNIIMNLTKDNTMKNTITMLSLLMALPALAEEPKCQIRETIHSEINGILPAPKNVDIRMESRQEGTYCVVTFDAGSHSVKGEQLVDGLGAIESCRVAEQKANKALAKQINDTQVTASAVMECNEQQNTVWHAEVGAVADVDQYKRDPERPREFIWNGTRCFWFQDVEWKGALSPFYGVACQLDDRQYVVVDKF